MMELTVNSYGYLVPKQDYEDLQKEVDRKNEIRMQGLIELNSLLESIGIDTIALDGNKPANELLKIADVSGTVPDSRLRCFKPPYRNPYDMDFKDKPVEECKRIMKQKIQNFRQLNPEKQFNDLAFKTKHKFENKLEYLVTISENPIRFELLNKVKNMSIEEFTRIYFNWCNNILSVEVFHINYVFNQWAEYFYIDVKYDYDFMTGENKDLKRNEFMLFGIENDEDKRIREFFNDLFN
jgi:hypothetical protein